MRSAAWALIAVALFASAVPASAQSTGSPADGTQQSGTSPAGTPATGTPATGPQGAGAQGAGAQPAGTAPTSVPGHVPEPYAPREFPGWLTETWRAEAVFVGSFPLTLFATLEAYDTWRYVNKGLDPGYAPWPFGSGAAAAYNPTEALWLAVTAVSLSVVVSGIDFLLGRLQRPAS